MSDSVDDVVDKEDTPPPASLEEILRFAFEEGEAQRAETYRHLDRLVKRGQLPANVLGLSAAAQFAAIALEIDDHRAMRRGLAEFRRLRSLGVSEPDIDEAFDEMASDARWHRVFGWLKLLALIVGLGALAALILAVSRLGQRWGLLQRSVGLGVDLPDLMGTTGVASLFVLGATVVRLIASRLVAVMSWPDSATVPGSTDHEVVADIRHLETEQHPLGWQIYGRRSKSIYLASPVYVSTVPILGFAGALATGRQIIPHLFAMPLGFAWASFARRTGRIMYERSGFEQSDELDRAAFQLTEARERARGESEDVILYLGSFLVRSAMWTAATVIVIGMVWNKVATASWLVDHVGGTATFVILCLSLLSWLNSRAQQAVLASGTDPQNLDSSTGDGSVILRAFSDDKLKLSYLMDERLRSVEPLRFIRTATFETLSTSILSAIGPVVAVGDPKTMGTPALGGSRLFFADQDWRSAVAILVERARLPVISLGVTDAVREEIEIVFSSPRRDSALFVVPPGRVADRAARLAFADALLGAGGKIARAETGSTFVLGFNVSDKIHLFTSDSITHYAYTALFREAMRVVETTEGRDAIRQTDLPAALAPPTRRNRRAIVGMVAGTGIGLWSAAAETLG